MNNNDQKDGYGHVLKYTSIFGGVQGLNILMGIIRNKLVALLLGPAGMGLAALLSSAVTFLSQATNLGISFSAVRNLSEAFDTGDSQLTDRIIKTVRGWSLIAALLGVLVCTAAAPLLSQYFFGDGSHALHFVALAPLVAMAAVTGGETAILKGVRRLRALATVQVYTVMASIVVAVPLYYFFGTSGIVPVLVLTGLASMLITIAHSYRAHPLSLKGIKTHLGEGTGMVRLGVAFILSGIMGSGAEMVIRAFLNDNADLGTVGLYNAGYILTVTYAGMVFSAMDNDYFPRLSAVNHDNAALSTVANRQAEVSLLLISPMIVTLILTLPLLVPLLYSGRFAPVVPMAQTAVMAMYLKTVTMPVEYITLAKGDSTAFLVLEVLFDVMMVLLIMAGFSRWGLTGTGAALIATYAVNMVMIFVYAGVRYKYRVSASVVKYMAMQLPIGAAAYLATRIESTAAYTAAAAALIVLSTAVSARVIYKKTSLWMKLKKKLLNHD